MFKKLCALAFVFSVSAAMGMNPGDKNNQGHFARSTRTPHFRIAGFSKGVGFVGSRSINGASDTKFNVKEDEKPAMFVLDAALSLQERLQ